MLGDFIEHADAHGEHAIGLMIRRERTQLIETIERSRAIYTRLGAKFHEQDKMWRFPNGARLRFAYLERDADAEAYQGHSYTRVYVEEISNFPTDRPILKLMATLRSGAGVPVGFRATGNPGGPGHGWVRKRYIDPAPLGWQVIEEEFENPWTKEKVVRDRVFIPSKVTDNKYLGASYVANLQMTGNEQVVRAWLEGDWNVIDGAFFPEFGLRHILTPFTVPPEWLRFRAMDWGSATPSSIGWWAVVPDDYQVEDGRILPRGALVRYREWYVSAGKNVGLRLPAEDIGEAIVAKEAGEKITYGVLDPSAFANDGGPSFAERMARKGAFFRRADNTRIAKSGSMSGWDQMRYRLRGEDDETPLIYCFATCVASIETIPQRQHDPDNPEDMLKAPDDHAADEWRYACMSRPWLPRVVEPAKPTTLVYEAQPDGRIVANMSVFQIVEMKRKRKELDA